jgi:hypothetical protein
VDVEMRDRYHSRFTLLLAIGNALSLVTAKDATQWFVHCGYGFI